MLRYHGSASSAPTCSAPACISSARPRRNAANVRAIAISARPIFPTPTGASAASHASTRSHSPNPVCARHRSEPTTAAISPVVSLTDASSASASLGLERTKHVRARSIRTSTRSSPSVVQDIRRSVLPEKTRPARGTRQRALFERCVDIIVIFNMRRLIVVFLTVENLPRDYGSTLTARRVAVSARAIGRTFDLITARRGLACGI